MQKVFSARAGNQSAVSGLILFAVAAICILCSPSVSALGAWEGLKLCSGVVIPSLFPFTAAAVFFLKSGALTWLGKKLDTPARIIFGVSGAGFAGVVLSLVGGYPVGAKLIDQMYAEGVLTENDANRLLRYAVNASPAFFLSVVGETVLNSRSAGKILFLSNLAACLILTAVTGHFHQNKRPHCEPPRRAATVCLSDAFVESVAEASRVMIGICAWVILFCSVAAYLRILPLSDRFYAAVCAGLEVTFGCTAAGKCGFPLPVFSLILAFGGLSSVCQVAQSAAHLKPGLHRIILYRLIHGGLAMLISGLLFRLSPPYTSVIQNAVEVEFTGFSLCLPSVMLMLFAVMFLMFVLPKSNTSQGK